MLKDTFYKVVSSLEKDVSSFQWSIIINKEHEIFEGHFPGLPIVPGVCMMQIIKELLQDKLRIKLNLKSASNIKFLSLINPTETNQVDVEVKYTSSETGTYIADGIISVNAIPYFKIVRAVYN